MSSTTQGFEKAANLGQQIVTGGLILFTGLGLLNLAGMYTQIHRRAAKAKAEGIA
ncbi:hypothetical protein HK098_006358, partial [Nowakowskiella sp. JEL0407]